MSIFAPSTFTEGSGLLDDVDVTFKEVRVAMFDYNGTVAVPVPALRIQMELEDGSGHEQYYSMGKASDWQPNEDGTSVVAVGKATGIASSSNAAVLLASMVNNGFPENRITDDVRCFEGMKAHMSRIAAPKRSGITKAPRADGRVFEDTVLVVGSIISLPGEKKAAPPKGKPNTATATQAKSATATAATEVVEDLDSKCTEVLMEILAENPDGVSKSMIPKLAFPKVGAMKDKNKIITRMFADDFLNNGPWTFEGGKVSL